MSHTFVAALIFFQESVGGLVDAPSQTAIEPTIVNLVSWLRLLIETTGTIIIAIGVVLALIKLARTLTAKRTDGYTEVRLLLAKYLILALEFQLAADILSTAIAPSWEQIGKLSAIAVIRTALNYFLSREMQQENHQSNTLIDNANQAEI